MTLTPLAWLSSSTVLCSCGVTKPRRWGTGVYHEERMSPCDGLVGIPPRPGGNRPPTAINHRSYTRVFLGIEGFDQELSTRSHLQLVRRVPARWASATRSLRPRAPVAAKAAILIAGRWTVIPRSITLRLIRGNSRKPSYRETQLTLSLHPLPTQAPRKAEVARDLQPVDCTVKCLHGGVQRTAEYSRRQSVLARRARAGRRRRSLPCCAALVDRAVPGRATCPMRRPVVPCHALVLAKQFGGEASCSTLANAFIPQRTIAAIIVPAFGSRVEDGILGGLGRVHASSPP